MALTVAVLLPLALLGLLVAGYRIVSGLPSVAYARAVQRLQRTADELESAYQVRRNTLEAYRELDRWQRFPGGPTAPDGTGSGGVPLAPTGTDSGPDRDGPRRPP